MTQLATNPDTHSHLAHQFDDPEQQRESATLGMWIFLATEIMLFGAILLAYTVYRHGYFDAFSAASNHLYVAIGSINTLVLLTSSLMMAMAVHSAEKGDSRRLVRYLILTLSLGLIFLAIKSFEYYLDYKESLIPLRGWWKPHSTDVMVDHHMRLFFIFYFILTLLHAIHMTIGLGLLGAMAWLAHRHRFSAVYHTPVEMVGLYWHFVDIVWVFLLPLLYLVQPGLHVNPG